MNKNLFIFLTLILNISSCVPQYGLNSKTSIIGFINVGSPELYHRTVDSLKNEINFGVNDSIWEQKYIQMNTEYFIKGDVLFFENNPRELILIDYYAVRAVYNPLLSSKCNIVNEGILNGSFSCLDSTDKIRITKRVNNLFK